MSTIKITISYLRNIVNFLSMLEYADWVGLSDWLVNLDLS